MIAGLINTGHCIRVEHVVKRAENVDSITNSWGGAESVIFIINVNE